MNKKKINNSLFDFTNSNVYIIGGSGLIGAKIVNDFLSLGANVISLDIVKPTFKNYKNKKNFIFKFFNCDLSSDNNFNFNELYNQNGNPNVLINCAYPRDNNWSNNNFSKIDFTSLKKNIDLHLISYSWIAKETANYMSKNKIHGSILLFSSIYGSYGQDLNLYNKTNMRENMSYSIIKGGIINLVRQMSSYYGQYNIRINSISPGGLYGHTAGKSKSQNQIFLKQYADKTPLGRLGKASEISKSAVFLSSPSASYITGANLIIDGGISIV